MGTSRDPSEISAAVFASIARSGNLKASSIGAETDLLSVGMDSLSVMGLIAEMQALLSRDLREDQMEAAFSAETAGQLSQVFVKCAQSQPEEG